MDVTCLIDRHNHAADNIDYRSDGTRRNPKSVLLDSARYLPPDVLLLRLRRPRRVCRCQLLHQGRTERLPGRQGHRRGVHLHDRVAVPRPCYVVVVIIVISVVVFIIVVVVFPSRRRYFGRRLHHLPPPLSSFVVVIIQFMVLFFFHLLWFLRFINYYLSLFSGHVLQHATSRDRKS